MQASVLIQIRNIKLLQQIAYKCFYISPFLHPSHPRQVAAGSVCSEHRWEQPGSHDAVDQ